jgi:hypothetical protein
MDILKIKSQIISPYFDVILKILKSPRNDLKSDFVKSPIKSLNTLVKRSSKMANSTTLAYPYPFLVRKIRPNARATRCQGKHFSSCVDDTRLVPKRAINYISSNQ